MTGMQRAMRRNGLIIAGTGVFFALAVLAPLHVAARLFLAVAYWPMATMPDQLVVPVGLMLAISGGLTAGIGMSIWAVGTYVAGEAPLAAAKVVRMTAWSWFAVDSTASVLTNAPFNVALNVGFLLLMLVTTRGAGAASPAPAQA